MFIYAIRDRMLNYYQRPFIADEDKQVLAALAQTINAGDQTNAMAQAPHHFELWKIAEITQDGVGAYTIEKEGDTLIATLDSLIRGSVRNTTADGPTIAKVEAAARKSQEHTGQATSPADGKHPPLGNPAQTAHRTT